MLSLWGWDVARVGYLHHIGRQDSATCPCCNGADEAAEHLVLQCLAYDQAWRDVWSGGKFNADPRRLWDFLEWIGAVTHSPDREWGRGRESSGCKCILMHLQLLKHIS